MDDPHGDTRGERRSEGTRAHRRTARATSRPRHRLQGGDGGFAPALQESLHHAQVQWRVADHLPATRAVDKDAHRLGRSGQHAHQQCAYPRQSGALALGLARLRAACRDGHARHPPRQCVASLSAIGLLGLALHGRQTARRSPGEAVGPRPAVVQDMGPLCLELPARPAGGEGLLGRGTGLLLLSGQHAGGRQHTQGLRRERRDSPEALTPFRHHRG